MESTYRHFTLEERRTLFLLLNAKLAKGFHRRCRLAGSDITCLSHFGWNPPVLSELSCEGLERNAGGRPRGLANGQLNEDHGDAPLLQHLTPWRADRASLRRR
jgi:hypothetical protein